jgi:hypothetical protein
MKRGINKDTVSGVVKKALRKAQKADAMQINGAGAKNRATQFSRSTSTKQ